MSDLPSIELLEATHVFPGEFVIKAIGRNHAGFVALIVAAVREELTLEVDPHYEVRQTTAGRHLSITLSPTVQSAAQVLAIYERIRTVDSLVMLL